jgi:hypothetical protein
LGYLRNNKQFGSDKQFSERLFRIYPSILSSIFSKGTFSVPSKVQGLSSTYNNSAFVRRPSTIFL